MAGTATKLLVIPPALQKAGESAAKLFMGGVKLSKAAVADIREATETLREYIRLGVKLPQYAVSVNATTVSAKGKTSAHGNVARHWRHADYLYRARDNAPIAETLETGYSMTDDRLSKLLAESKPLMIEAGLLDAKSKAAESHAVRAAKAIDRAAKRIEGWETKGIKATVGATSDIPAFNAVAMLRLRLAGATVEKLTRACSLAEKPADKATDAGETPPADAPSSPAPVKGTGRRPRKARTGTEG